VEALAALGVSATWRPDDCAVIIDSEISPIRVGYIGCEDDDTEQFDWIVDCGAGVLVGLRGDDFDALFSVREGIITDVPE
jgi:hypothetical protein